MENITQAQIEAQGAAYWNNEVEYLINATEGLKTSYGILQAMLTHAKKKLQEAEQAEIEQGGYIDKDGLFTSNGARNETLSAF